MQLQFQLLLLTMTQKLHILVKMGIAIQLEILLEPVTLMAHYQETHLCVQVSKNDSVGLVYYRYKCIKVEKNILMLWIMLEPQHT